MNLEIKEMTKEDLDRMMMEHKELNPDRRVRSDIINSLERYVTMGVAPGSFLLAVLENDLMNAFGRADSYNRVTLFQICEYVYNKLPTICHGSPEAVKEWIDAFKENKK